ncbi:MAG TPA: hypothetical protein VKZ51_12165 [Cyclobacteriaceae bacterium]|nr:hypothetical protein [Cyclobacteriaceae bacterium]
MKRLICIISIAGLVSLGSCDNANRGIEDNNKADNDLMDQRDTSAINDELNPRGVPKEGLPGDNDIRNDTLGGERNEMMGDIPAAISEKIMQDQTLRKKRLTNTRKYSEGGRTYYELTFDNEQDQVVFDEDGNMSASPD